MSNVFGRKSEVPTTAIRGTAQYSDGWGGETDSHTALLLSAIPPFSPPLPLSVLVYLLDGVCIVCEEDPFYDRSKTFPLFCF